MNSLGIDKDPAQTRVVVAMSGGVDSSVTAALLVEQGYEVIGMTMQLYDAGEAEVCDTSTPRTKTCCAGQDIYDARRVADTLSIPHYVMNYESNFKADVMERFADAYVEGQTPVPCVLCNQTVKFRDLLDAAQGLGADALATGHYVQRVSGEDGPQLMRGVDVGKDQSYFLFATTRDQLDFVRFPLGGLSKDETREIARRHKLAVADKPDSQDICFVPDGDYARVVKALRPEAAEPGDIVNKAGDVLGRHQGIIHYTVGQRRGLRIGGTAEPLYVLALRPDRREVVVGPKAELALQSFTVHSVNWLGEGLVLPDELSVAVKIRNTSPETPALIRALPDGRAEVVLPEPAYGVSPGQACVFYDGKRVLGGGWIARMSATNDQLKTTVPHHRRAKAADNADKDQKAV